MRNFIFQRGTRIVFGGGCVREYLASFAQEYGPNVLLASGEGSVRHNGVYDEVCQTLRRAGKQVVEFPGIRPGPDYDTVQRGARLAREHQVDLVLGIGGGSVVDCCKATAMAAVYQGDLWADFWARQGVVDFQPLPVGLIPTTVGTGGLNGISVVTNRALGIRTGRDYPKCDPRFVLLDPAYTRSLSREQVIAGGFDALSRAMELYFAPPEGETVSDDLLGALMRGLIRDLRANSRDLQNSGARGDLMWAGTLAGDRLFRLGKRCGYPCRRAALQLMERTGHSRTDCLAVLQLAACRRSCEEQPARTARFARRVWDIPEEGRTEKALARAGAEALEAFLLELGLPTRPEALGLEYADLLPQSVQGKNLWVYTA